MAEYCVFNGSKQYYGSIIIPFWAPRSHRPRVECADLKIPIYGLCFYLQCCKEWRWVGKFVQIPPNVIPIFIECRSIWLSLRFYFIYSCRFEIQSFYLKVSVPPFSKFPVKCAWKAGAGIDDTKGSKSIDSISIWSSVKHPSTWACSRMKFVVGARCTLLIKPSHTTAAKLLTLRIECWLNVV